MAGTVSLGVPFSDAVFLSSGRENNLYMLIYEPEGKSLACCIFPLREVAAKL
jgi:hypothetical protein